MVRTPSGGKGTEQPNEQQTDGRRTLISEGDIKWMELLNGQYEVIKFCFSHPIPFKTYWTQILLFLKPVSGQKLFSNKAASFLLAYNLVFDLARGIPDGGRC